MSRIAVYAGSFDPLTNGHKDVIVRGAALFDELVVAVGFNPAKKSYTFDLEQRMELVRRSCAEIDNLRVVSFSGLLVDLVHELGADVILRGLRALADFDLEFRNGLANRDLSDVETLFLLADPAMIFVSSSLVKEIAFNGGDCTAYVPPVVAEAMARKIAQRGLDLPGDGAGPG